jgi:hypothetical protein
MASAATAGGHLSPVVSIGIALFLVVSAIHGLKYMIFGPRKRQRRVEVTYRERRGGRVLRLLGGLYGLLLLRGIRREQRRIRSR